MQIMPATAYFVQKGLLQNPVAIATAIELSQDPVANMEMGVVYLDHLLKTFSGNYRMATVAYNMGPYGVKRRLRKGLPVGVRNLYLDKVRLAYTKFSKIFKAHVYSMPRPYLLTYVVKRKRPSTQLHIDRLLRVNGNLLSSL